MEKYKFFGLTKEELQDGTIKLLATKKNRTTAKKEGDGYTTVEKKRKEKKVKC